MYAKPSLASCLLMFMVFRYKSTLYLLSSFDLISKVTTLSRQYKTNVVIDSNDHVFSSSEVGLTL